MQVALIAEAIVFSKRSDATKLVIDVLKMKGTSNIMSPESANDCIEQLRRSPKGLLIVDWHENQQEAVKVLAANLKRGEGRSRPILLIASAVDQRLIATAAEYGVSQIFTDALTNQNLAARITGVIFAEAGTDDVKAALQEIAPLRASKDWTKAQKIINRVLAKHPQNLKIKSEAGLIAIELGAFARAEELLTAMTREKPPFLRGVTLLGRCYLKQGKTKEAIEVLSTANLFNPHNSERLVTLGQALVQSDRTSEARVHFEDAFNLDGDSRDAKLGLAQCDLLEGDVNEGLTILKDVADTQETAAIFNMCAVLNARKGKHGAGLNLYDEALKACGESTAIKARLHFNKGLAYRRWQKPAEARTEFEKALQLDPGLAKASSQLASLDGKKKDTSPQSIYDHSDVFSSSDTDFMEDSLEESLFSGPGKFSV